MYRLIVDGYETEIRKDENELPAGWIACPNPKTGEDAIVSGKFGWRYYFVEEVA